MLVSWKEKESIYSVLVPPLKKEEYEMNAKETKEYFEWYMSKIPERIEYLQEVCSEYLNIPKECIDCSPESLKYVWKWFLDIAKVERVTEEDRERMRQEMGGANPYGSCTGSQSFGQHSKNR